MSRHDHVGVQLGGAGDERVVVLGDADHLDVGIAREHRPHAFTDDDAVVGQEHRDRPHGTMQAGRMRRVKGVTRSERGVADHTTAVTRHHGGRFGG